MTAPALSIAFLALCERTIQTGAHTRDAIGIRHVFTVPSVPAQLAAILHVGIYNDGNASARMTLGISIRGPAGDVSSAIANEDLEPLPPGDLHVHRTQLAATFHEYGLYVVTVSSEHGVLAKLPLRLVEGPREAASTPARARSSGEDDRKGKRRKPW